MCFIAADYLCRRLIFSIRAAMSADAAIDDAAAVTLR